MDPIGKIYSLRIPLYSGILWAALFIILLPVVVLFLQSTCWVHLSVVLLKSILGIASCATIISACSMPMSVCFTLMLTQQVIICYKLLHFFWALDLLYGSPTSMNFKHYHFIDCIASLVVNWFWHFLPLNVIILEPYRLLMIPWSMNLQNTLVHATFTQSHFHQKAISPVCAFKIASGNLIQL